MLTCVVPVRTDSTSSIAWWCYFKPGTCVHCVPYRHAAAAVPPPSRPSRCHPPACPPATADAGVVHLSRLVGLECLDLFGARITDAGCAALTCVLSAMIGGGVQCGRGAAGSWLELTGGHVLRCGGTTLLLTPSLHPPPTPKPKTKPKPQITLTPNLPSSRCSKLQGLQRLEVCGGYLTDAGAGHLAALSTLQHLSLAQVCVRVCIATGGRLLEIASWRLRGISVTSSCGCGNTDIKHTHPHLPPVLPHPKHY